MIIDDAHEKAGHEGRQYVMKEVRAKYWILKANSAVRRRLTVGQASPKPGIKLISIVTVSNMYQYGVKYHAEAESDVRFHARQVTLVQQPMTSLLRFSTAQWRGGI